MDLSSGGPGDAQSNVVELDKSEEEYERVHYFLKLCLQGRQAAEIGVWKIENSQMSVAFERRTSGSLTLDCWVDTGELDDMNAFEDVCRRGFLFKNREGMIFRNGILTLDDASQMQQHLYLLCEVGLGRSFIVRDPAILDVPVPRGYDALYVPDKRLDENQDGIFSLEEYQQASSFDNRDCSKYFHRFLLKDPSQVLPRYVVRFYVDIDDDPEKNGALAQTNQMDRIEFFDPILYQPVSYRDKMEGSYSTGECATHKLISLDDAYNSCLQESQKEDAVLSRRRSHINEQLQVVDDRLRQVNLNYADVEQVIFETLRKTLKELQDLTREKMEVLLSTELELRRELEEIDWSEQFVGQVRGGAGKARFLSLWKYHTQFRSRVCRKHSLELDIVETVQPDLLMVGDVSVIRKVSDQSIKFHRLFGTGSLGVLDNDRFPATGTVKLSKSEAEASRNANVMESAATTRQSYQVGAVEPNTPGDMIGDDAGEGGGRQHGLQKSYATGAQIFKLNLSADILAGSYLSTGVSSDDVMAPTSEQVLAQGHRDIQAAMLKVSRSSVPIPPSLMKPPISGSVYTMPTPATSPGYTTASNATGSNVTDKWSEFLRKDMKVKLEDTTTTIQPTAPNTGNSGASAAGSRAAKTSKPFLANQNSLRGQTVNPGQQAGRTGQRGSEDKDNAPEAKPQAGGKQRFQKAVDTVTTMKAVVNTAKPTAQSKGSVAMNASQAKPSSKLSSAAQPASSAGGNPNSRMSEDSSNGPVDGRPRTVAELSQIAKQFSQYSLSQLALRKKRQTSETAAAAETDMFAGTNILSNEQAETLYYCLPFTSTLPVMSLVYSSIAHPRSVEGMLESLVKLSRPTIFIIRSGPFIFGGFASEGWKPDGIWKGNSRCFLFSITLDVKIPYTGRVVDTESKEPHCAFKCDPDSIQFGLSDLVLSGDLGACLSVLEKGYGIGLRPEHARCFLAGSRQFSADAVEVWKF